MLLAQGIAGEHRQQELHVEVFTPGQEFEKAQAIRRTVSPRRWMRGSINQRADCLLPFVVFAQMLAFKVIASRKAKKGRMQGSQLLHKVDTLTVGLVLIGRRKSEISENHATPGCSTRNSK